VPAFASEQLQIITSADPERVWRALTATGSPLDYLHGMTVESDWRPGASVTMTVTGHWRLTGEVLAAEPPRGLSYTLDDPPGAPAVYVTWELRRVDDGTIIRLHVDEPWPVAGDTDDLETAWLPVLSGLARHLERGSTGPDGTSTGGQQDSRG
jgi:uncharacterized protein YndB with AHSA1/START domain